MNIDIILDGPGGELERQRRDVGPDDINQDDRVNEAAQDVIGGWRLAAGDTIRILEIEE